MTKTKSQIGKSSKARGKRGELSLVHVLRDAGFLEARRTAQYCGKAGTSDVTGLPGIHVEVKNVQRLNIWEALAQSKRDSEADGNGDIAAVFFKRNRSGWYVAVPLSDFIRLYAQSDLCKGDVNKWVENIKAGKKDNLQ